MKRAQLSRHLAPAVIHWRWHLGEREMENETVVFFPLAVLEWFNLLSIRPFVIRRWFRHNPKFRETYHIELDTTGIHFRTRSIDSGPWWRGTFSLEGDVAPRNQFKRATVLEERIHE